MLGQLVNYRIVSESARRVRWLSLSFWLEHRRRNLARTVSSFPNTKVRRCEVLMLATLDLIEDYAASSIFVGHIARPSDHNAIRGSCVFPILSLGVPCRKCLVNFCFFDKQRFLSSWSAVLVYSRV